MTLSPLSEHKTLYCTISADGTRAHSHTYGSHIKHTIMVYDPKSECKRSFYRKYTILRLKIYDLQKYTTIRFWNSTIINMNVYALKIVYFPSMIVYTVYFYSRSYTFRQDRKLFYQDRILFMIVYGILYHPIRPKSPLEAVKSRFYILFITLYKCCSIS